jgi:choline monooxygenase
MNSAGSGRRLESDKVMYSHPHRSPIPPSAYVSDHIFSLEQERIFRSLWIFVGVKQLLKSHNSFITRSIGGIPIVIQNIRGRIRAFENRCLHRQMMLQTEAIGQRRMVCRYHGWSYGENGCVKGIANAALYELSSTVQQELCLREFALKEVGNLVFICINENPPPLISQFSPDFLETLEASSMEFDWEVAYAKFDVRYNWKLNFENVLDWNHVQFIHDRTFYQCLSRTNRKNERPTISANLRKVQAQLDSGKSIPLQVLSFAIQSPMQNINDFWENDVGKYGDVDDYYNWFIYPNVNYCSTRGKSFLIQQYEPKSPEATEYHLWCMLARRRDKHARLTGALSSMISAEKRIIDEDTAVLERLQSNLNSSGALCVNGAYEAHIVRMHRWYCKRLEL